MSENKIKILLVEDEYTLAEIIADTLGEKGFEVNIAHNGVEALKAMAFLPDVVVTDIMMPQMDGLTFVKELRKTHPAMPVLFLSARTTAEDVVEGFETGGNDYLRKPFAMSELIIRIKSLIARSGGAIVKEFKIGKFTFNVERMTLKLTTDSSSSASASDSYIVQLSTRESQVLAMLCAKIGNVVTSKDILMNLWGDDSFFNSRSLQVYITKLRKHLESDSSITLSNIRGVGYKLFVL